MGDVITAVRTAVDEAPAPTLEEIRRWSATVTVPKACAAYGLSRSYGYELAGRGEFPAKVIKVGGRYLVVTASIVAALSGDA